jgi:hypothetical protein
LNPTGNPLLGRVSTAATLIMLATAVAACGAGVSSPSAVSSPAAGNALTMRLVAIDDAVNDWRSASDLATARAAAEEARNLVVGPAGPYYGDGDGDGMIEGESEIGLLPGLGGEPGLAAPTAGDCVVRDVLGGSWSEPGERWAILETAIDDWSDLDNTFPALPSHPQRIVGWATLALASTDVAAAREYGGHAHLHIDIAMRATTGCTP